MFIKALRSFVNDEPLYAWLLIGSLVVYSGMSLLFEQPTDTPSPALERFKQAETALAKEAYDGTYARKLLEKDPGLAVLFLASFVGFAGISLAGCGVLVAGLVARLRRKALIVPVEARSAVPWGWREIVKVCIWYVAASLVLGIVFSVLNSLLGERYENTFLIVHTVLVDGLAIGVLGYYVFRVYGGSLVSLGLTMATFAKDIRIGLMAYCGIFPLFIAAIGVLGIIVQVFHYEPPPHPLVDVFVTEDGKSPLLVYGSIVLACTVGPFIEEIFFRGFCYTALRKVWGARRAMIGTALFFALVHFSWFAFLPVFILGCALAYVYERRGTLVPSIALHVVHNSIFIGYFFLIKRLMLDTV